MSSRRAILRRSIVATTALASGCQSFSLPPTSKDCADPQPEEYVQDWHEDTVRGEATPVKVPYDKKSSPTTGEVTEVEEPEAIRAEYDDQEFDWRTAEQWSDVDCGIGPDCLDAGDSVGHTATAVRLVLERKLGDLDSVGTGVSRGEPPELHTSVNRKLILTCDGDVVSRPSAEFESLRGAAPETGFVVKETDEVVVVSEVSVYVEDMLLQEQ